MTSPENDYACHSKILSLKTVSLLDSAGILLPSFGIYMYLYN